VTRREVREEKHEQNRIDMDALSQMVDDYETQLKFVVTDASDLPRSRTWLIGCE